MTWQGTMGSDNRWRLKEQPPWLAWLWQITLKPRMMWAVARGRPVMYRIHTDGAVAFSVEAARSIFMVENRFDAPPSVAPERDLAGDPDPQDPYAIWENDES